MLADSPPVPQDGRQEAEAPVGPAPVPAPPGTEGEGARQACPKCGAEMAGGQDWCLQCGAGAPGSVGTGGWRPAAAVLAATTVLVLAAAAAGYAALSRSPRHAALVVTTVAQVTPAPAVTPTTPAPGTVTPTTPAPLASIAKPPKIPLQAATPAPAVTSPATTTPAAKAARPPAPAERAPPQPPQAARAAKKRSPNAILLDTNAAQTYNPYNYPASEFGDPSLAIDGDTSTGWTARVNPATAPGLAEGLLIDLKKAQKLSAVTAGHDHAGDDGPGLRRQRQDRPGLDHG